jgi:transposase
MVRAVRQGESLRMVARRFHVSVSTVYYWTERAEGKRLGRIDWQDRSHRPHRIHRTKRSVEKLVVRVRTELKNKSVLGEYGAEAIQRELVARGKVEIPAIRTIGRILERHGALDDRRRRRHPPPPAGWYLPEVGNRSRELDSFDVIEGLIIEGGINVEVLNAISLHGGLIGSWPDRTIFARTAVQAMIEHWKVFGLPAYAQFDNDTRFQGAHQFRDTLGRVIRLCLSLGVTAVFAPPRETGFQAAVESLNARWQAKIWQRFHFESLGALQTQSARYVAAYRQRARLRIESAPLRRFFPFPWKFDLQARPKGCVIYLRRTDAHGRVSLLGHSFVVDSSWPHRLVRAHVDLIKNQIRFHALRRREPTWQPIVKTVPYHFPKRNFRDDH